MEFVRRHRGLILRAVISIVILGGLASRLNWDRFRVMKVDLVWVLVAGLVWGGSALIAAMRWRMLLSVQGIVISAREAIELFFVGHFFNAFLLGTTGGDVVKIYYATKLTGSNKEGAGLSVVMDRIIGLIAILFMALLLIGMEYSFLAQTTSTRAAVWAVFGLIVGGLGLGGIAWMLPSLSLPDWIQKRLDALPFQEIRRKLIEAFARFTSAWKVNLIAIGISFLIHGCTLVMAVSLMKSLGVSVPVLPFVSTLPIIGCLMSVPITISGLGLREGLFVVFLAMPPVSVAAEPAVAFSLLMYGVTLAWSLVGGLVYLRYRGPVSEEAAGLSS